MASKVARSPGSEIRSATAKHSAASRPYNPFFDIAPPTALPNARPRTAVAGMSIKFRVELQLHSCLLFMPWNGSEPEMTTLLARPFRMRSMPRRRLADRLSSTGRSEGPRQSADKGETATASRVTGVSRHWRRPRARDRSQRYRVDGTTRRQTRQLPNGWRSWSDGCSKDVL